eukprot:11148095-Heterocapsa_arctica.AAC.1
MFITFLNDIAKSSGFHWAFGLHESQDLLTCSRRSANGVSAEARMKVEKTGNVWISGTYTSA